MNVEQEIEAVKERNKRVEADKAWELSWTRRVLIALSTYILIVLFMFFAGLPSPFINAIVPSAAYLVSMSAMPYFKKWWLNQRNK
ncbi:hypothetical protein JXA05_02360 [Candidatus Peregrinibacteria bacterium]|nr:hypothetical protein [Candidatus Peregrinibacteria bacterium]